MRPFMKSKAAILNPSAICWLPGLTSLPGSRTDDTTMEVYPFRQQNAGP